MSGGGIFNDNYGRRNAILNMPRILLLGKQPQMRRLLSESLCFDGYEVESVADAVMLWEHLSNSHPDLVLLDVDSDGFGAMKLYFGIKEKLPDLAVIVFQSRNYGDVARIKGAVADALQNKVETKKSATTSRPLRGAFLRPSAGGR
jgi:DNA-binding NtrC family response regulator